MQQLTAPRPLNLFGMADAHRPWQFDGQWRVVLCLRGGQDGSWGEYLELRENTFSTHHDSPATGRIVLQHDWGQPAKIDFVYSMESGLHSGDRIEGIYRPIGEQVLIINLGLDAEGEAHYARPTNFAPTKLSTFLVLLREVECCILKPAPLVAHIITPSRPRERPGGIGLQRARSDNFTFCDSELSGMYPKTTAGKRLTADHRQII